MTCFGTFEDPEFPPNDTSLGHLKGDTASGVVNKGGATDWRKASEIVGQDSGSGAQLFQGEIEPADLLQGALGDCWLIAALACVAERPEILQQAIVSKQVDPRGKYHFRLWNQVGKVPGTRWENITIDEFIPCYQGSFKPKFAKSNANEMWALLLEKAFAKMYKGYSALEGGQMSWALTAITGNPSVSFDRQNKGGVDLWNAAQGGFYTNDTFDDDDFYKF
ncbi:unnamed protein product, partial [Polarella glacialis]